MTPPNESKPKRKPKVLVGDLFGRASSFLESRKEELGVELELFEQPATLAMAAADSRADLAVVVNPDTLLPLERLRNDPRTGHIPLLLVIPGLVHLEKQFLSLAVADHVIDYPFEEEVLLEWVSRGIRRKLVDPVDQHYASADVDGWGAARFVGRLCWVDGNRCGFETDVALPEGSRFRFSGPLASTIGDEEIEGSVLSCSKHDVYYDHAWHLELDLKPSEGQLNLGEALSAHRFSIARTRRGKIALVSHSNGKAGDLAEAVGTDDFLICPYLDLKEMVDDYLHSTPAAVIIDPDLPDLESEKWPETLEALPSSLPIFPLSRPRDPSSWELPAHRILCLDVPRLAKDSWQALLSPLIETVDPEQKVEGSRTYLRRESALSHGRVSIPLKLDTLSEVGGTLTCRYQVAANARFRLDVRSLAAAGLPPLCGRFVEGTQADEAAHVVWMGLGGMQQCNRVRGYIQQRVVQQRSRTRARS